MIKISINLKDVIESLSDLLTIGESNTIPNHFTDILLNQDIKFSFTSLNKENYVLAKSLYFFDSKSLMYIDIGSPFIIKLSQM